MHYQKCLLFFVKTLEDDILSINIHSHIYFGLCMYMAHTNKSSFDEILKIQKKFLE